MARVREKLNECRVEKCIYRSGGETPGTDVIWKKEE
jgi:hypothetical protein